MADPRVLARQGKHRWQQWPGSVLVQYGPARPVPHTVRGDREHDLWVDGSLAGTVRSVTTSNDRAIGRLRKPGALVTDWESRRPDGQVVREGAATRVEAAAALVAERLGTER